MHRSFPNVIIFGGMRCGTTSLFRYLSAHPDVFTSSKKELDFFFHNLDVSRSLIEEKYKRSFLNYIGKESILLEASPRYARRYSEVSRKIGSVIPDCKIIYLIRNPIDRLVSVYRSVNRSGAFVNGVSIDGFIQAIYKQDMSIFVDEEQSIGVMNELRLGLYAPIIRKLIKEFGTEQLFVESLESLSKMPNDVMTRICEFIEIKEGFYEKYSFSVENPSVSAKSPKIYKMALIINAALEPILNRFPIVRLNIRNLHHALNTSGHKDVPSAQSLKLLNSYYSNDQQELYKLVKHLGTCSIPQWLTKER